MGDEKNSTKTARAVPGRPFPKGVSGNPKGRPKTPKEFKELCFNEGAPKAFACLIRELENDGKDRVRASEILMAYGIGKPKQSIEHAGADGGKLEIIIHKYGDENVQ
jgi:hypothetical protein